MNHIINSLFNCPFPDPLKERPPVAHPYSTLYSVVVSSFPISRVLRATIFADESDLLYSIYIHVDHLEFLYRGFYKRRLSLSFHMRDRIYILRVYSFVVISHGYIHPFVPFSFGTFSNSVLLPFSNAVL